MSDRFLVSGNKRDEVAVRELNVASRSQSLTDWFAVLVTSGIASPKSMWIALQAVWNVEPLAEPCTSAGAQWIWQFLAASAPTPEGVLPNFLATAFLARPIRAIRRAEPAGFAT